MVILDISSDEDVGCKDSRRRYGGVCGSGGSDDYGWISELLGSEDGGTDGSDDVVVVSEVVSKPKQKMVSSVKDVGGGDDDDCVVLEGDPDKPTEVNNDEGDDSDDLVVVGEKGQVACRDYPHPRHHCAKFSFSSTPHEKYCDQCHCYVCDSLAPCAFWGTGTSSNDHCHATDKDDFWKAQRQTAKEIDKAASVIRKFPDTSISRGALHINQIPSTPTAPSFMPQNQMFRPAAICPGSTPTNVVRVNVHSSQGGNQRPGHVLPRNRYHPYLVSEHLHASSSNVITGDRSHNAGQLGHQNVPRHWSTNQVASTTDRYCNNSSRNNSSSDFSLNASQGTVLPNSNCRLPLSNTYRVSFQHNIASFVTDSVPSQIQSSTQHSLGGGYANYVPSGQQVNYQRQAYRSQPQVLPPQCENFAPSHQQEVSLPTMGNSLGNPAHPHAQLAWQQNPGNNYRNAPPIESVISSWPNSFSTSTEALSPPPFVYTPPVPALSESQNALQQENQRGFSVNVSADLDISWLTHADQGNQQFHVDNHLHVERPIDKLPPAVPATPQSGSNLDALEFDFERWMHESPPEVLHYELRVPSPEPTPLDSCFIFDF